MATKRVEETIDVNVPIRTAYNQWTQFEEFPKFMDGIESVTQLDDKRLVWVANIGGNKKQWEAEIDEQTPDQRIAWHATTGSENAGAVNFHYIDENTTRLNVIMDVETEGAVETAGAALGLLERRVRGDLERFKEFIESRGAETGAWRGEIHQEKVESR